MSINHKEFKQQTDQIQMQKDAQQAKQENAHSQQVQKEPINIEQTATAQATVQVEGLEPVLLQLNDQGAYLTQAVQGQNIANVTEPAPLQVVADSFDDALMSLSYQDFVKMVGTYNRGQVELVDGKLQIINNHYFSMSKGKESINNRLVRERFLVLAMQKLGDQMTPELSDRFRRILQLDQEGTKSLPLTRKQIHDVLADVNMRTSEVSKILFLGSKADPAQSEFAKRADYMVAGNLSAYDRSHTTPETQERFRQEIKSIFKRAKRFDENLSTLSQHQMDNLVNGNIELVREQIYHSYRKSYEYRVNLEKGGSVDPKQFMDNSVPVDLVAAYTINLMAAATEEGKALVQAKLDDVLLRIASGMYRTKNSKDVQRANYYQAYKKMEIGDLSSGGSDGLEETVLERSQNSETLRENKERTNQGVADLAHLCDQFRELNVLKEKGLKQGISKEERIRMNAIATDLYTIMTQEKQLEAGVSPMGMVATQLEGTRFAEGYQQLRGMLTEGFSIKTVVRTLSYTTEQKESHTNQHLSERVQIPNEELETAKGMAYRLDMLEGHAREIASVVVLTAAPSEYIKKAKDPDIKVYQDIHDEMKKWKFGGAHKMEYSHQGLTFTLEQKESGLIDLLIDGTRITLPVNAGLIVDALETDMIQHEELYGSEPIKAVFRGLDPSEKEPTEWTHSRLLCLKYLQSKTGKAGDYFNNIATNVLRRFAIYLLSGDLDLEEINKTVKSVDRACKSVRLNGVETLELIGMAELQAQKQQELAGNEFLEEVPKTRRVHREDDGWTEEEHQVKDMIADCIFSADTWTTDQTDKPALLLQKTLEQHVDTLVLLARKPQMLEDMIKKIPLLQDTGLAEQMHEVLSSLMNNMVYRLAKAFVPDETLKSMIRQALHTDLAVEKMTEAEAKLENMMKKSMRSIQKHISSQTKDLFGDSDEETPQTASEEQLSPVLKQRLENDPELMRKYEFNRSVDKLGDMMRQAASGSRGQGRFMQLVLNSYFRRVSAIDRRAMFASALRDAKPIPNLPEDATKEDWDRANRQCMGANLGGFLKGAGPLLHKMLQGLPTEAMPEELRSALKDVKSNLAPIPEEIVRSQMDAMVARSHGLVDRIEIVRAQGTGERTE